MIPLLVGDVDRAGEFLRCRERLPDGPPLFPPGGDKSNPLLRIDTSWMKSVLHIMMQYNAIHMAPIDRLAALFERGSSLIDGVEGLLRHNLTHWSSAVVGDDICMTAAGIRGSSDAFFRACSNARAHIVLQARRDRSPIGD
jgi:hypothetical protein